MPGWLEASLKLGLRRPQLSTDRSHGLLAANRLAEKASKFQSNYIKLRAIPTFIISTLNFGPSSTKLGGTVQAIKKMTQNDNGPGPGRNYGEMGVFTFVRKVVFGLKTGFTPKNHPK